MRLSLALLISLCVASLGAWSAVAQVETPAEQDAQQHAAPQTEETDRAAALDRLFESLSEASSFEIGRGIEQLIWAIWLNAGGPEADRLMALSVDAMSRYDYPRALDHLDQIVELEPDLAEGWNKRATVYFLVGDYERSLSDIDRTLALEARHFGALSGRGMILDSLGRKEEALAAFREALTIHPQMPAVQGRVDVLSEEVEGVEL